MVAHGGVVTGEAQNVVNTKEGSAEKIRLQTHSVAVTAGQLIDGKQTCILQHLTGSQTAQTHDRGLVVGHVHSGNAAQIGLGFFYQVVNMKSFGRAYFRSYYELTLIKQFSNSHSSHSLL